MKKVSKSKKCKRGKRKSVKSVEKCLIIGGVNPDGAMSKITTIRKAVIETRSSVWMMQETKSQPGSIQFDGFVTYEHTRLNQDGGGVSISAMKELNPCLIRDGGEEVEALTVRIHLKKIIISMNTGYGPQEYDKSGKKSAFWNYFDEEAQRAQSEGHGFMLQGDMNARLGPAVITSDTKPANENGKLFANFVARNQLTIVNTLDICKGSTTWTKMRDGKELKSTIDFIVVCKRVLPFVTKMIIDNDNDHRITNFNNVKKGGKTTEADHTPMWIEINLKISPEKTEKIELTNFKDPVAQKNFKRMTDETEEFTRCTESEKNITDKIEIWKHLLNDHCKKSFKKMRIRKKKLKPSKADKLINERNKLIKNHKEENSEEIKKLDMEISNTIATEEREKFLQFKQFEDQNGSTNMSEMWKLKKKLWPKKASALPAAKINHHGKIVSTGNEVKEALQKEYTERLRRRPKHPNISKVYKKKTIEIKLKSSENNKSSPFKMEEFDNVIFKLKRGKARDPEGWARELFHPQVMGQNLKMSLLSLLNQVKLQGRFPQFMRRATIATIPKGNKSRLKMSNERGIFLVNIIRGIFMKMLFNRNSRKIDQKMSDSNIGGRKNKSCLNHIWVMNGIIHETLSSTKNAPIVIQQYDYTQMFDGMDLKESLADLENNAEIKDDTIHLLYQANKHIEVKVKTPFGLTKQLVVDEAVLQGEVWGSALASNQVDTFGKEMLEEEFPFIFKYKGYIPVPILGQIDDTIGVTEAGFKAVQLNSFMNVKTADKYLQFGQEKCKAMLVGKRTSSFHMPQLEVDTWKTYHDKDGNLVESFEGKKPMETTNELTYLGVQLSSNGSNMNSIMKKRNKQCGNRKQFENLLKPLGKYNFECGFIFFNSIVRNSVLYGTEVMYNIIEKEKREIEKIEESQIRNIFHTKTGIQIPIHLMYLDGGQVPARYLIARYRMNYLQYILHQEETSFLYSMLRAQEERPTKGDWFSETQKNIQEFEINLSNSEIRAMSKNKFHKITKLKTEKLAWTNLLFKQKNGKKGKYIEYSDHLQMADYLHPNSILNLEDQILMFQIRSETNPLPANRGDPGPCPMNCKSILDNPHILMCAILNKEDQTEYTHFVNGNMNQLKLNLEKWRRNMDKMSEVSALDSLF